MASFAKLRSEVCTDVFCPFTFRLIKGEGCLHPRLEDPWLLALESVNFVQIDSVLVFV